MSRSAHLLALSVIVVWVAGCDATTDGSRQVDIGECAPPTGSSDLPLTALSLGFDHCLPWLANNLAVVDSTATWDGLFPCPTPVPAGLDLVTQRAAVVQLRCSPIEARFAVETAREVVVGIHQGISGACIDAPVVVPLPRSAKPVRLALCQQSCEGDCPPVP